MGAPYKDPVYGDVELLSPQDQREKGLLTGPLAGQSSPAEAI